MISVVECCLTCIQPYSGGMEREERQRKVNLGLMTRKHLRSESHGGVEGSLGSS